MGCLGLLLVVLGFGLIIMAGCLLLLIVYWWRVCYAGCGLLRIWFMVSFVIWLSFGLWF